MLPRKVTVGPSLNNSVNSVALTQTVTGAGTAFTLNGALVVGGVADMPSSAQRLLVTPAGAEGTNSTVLTVVGTDWNGNLATETITVPNNPSTIASVYDYATVTSITTSKTTAGNIQIGTNGSGSSRPIFLDTFAPAPTALQIDVTGTVNATVQQTLDDPNTSSTAYLSVNWVNHGDTNLVGLSSNVQGNYAYLPRMCRILLNSGSGSVTLTVIQADA